MGMVVNFDQRRASENSFSRSGRAAIRAKTPAVRDARSAVPVFKIGFHHSAGMRSRCHHLLTCAAVTPLSTSAAQASRVGQSSMIERNELKSAVIAGSNLGQIVLDCKPAMSCDCGPDRGLNPAMPDDPTASEFKHRFIERVREARAARFTQNQISKLLGIAQDTYKQYETRSFLPYHLLPRFCLLCGISVESLFEAPTAARNAQKPVSRPKRHVA